jgi:hypothetical protein
MLFVNSVCMHGYDCNAAAVVLCDGAHVAAIALHAYVHWYCHWMLLTGG